MRYEPITLGKFIAHAGVCSRRKATLLIKNGKIKVNDILTIQLNYKVLPTDRVTYQGRLLKKEKKTYILLNKPKGYIATLQDEKGRKNVRQLIDYKTAGRIYPVGRLDRDTTGLLLFTNDGDLAKKLAHPSQEVEKIYYVTLTSPINELDLQQLKKGLHLKDGFIQVDKVQVLNQSKTRLSLALHTGQNRIIRRSFAHLGYLISRLDRMFYAGLTKKNLPLRAWRFLTVDEIKRLQNLRKMHCKT